MRRILLVLAVFLTFISAASARQAAYTRATALQASLKAALSYWGQPACGIPHLRVVTETPGGPFSTGYTYVSDDPADDPCYSDIVRALVDDAPTDPEGFYMLCHVVAHEVGHLVLPADYFTSNPSDQGESGDPKNIMFQWTDPIEAVTTPQCLTAIQHPFIYDGRYVTVRLRRYPRSSGCAVTLFDRRGRRVGLEAWACQITDRTHP